MNAQSKVEAAMPAVYSKIAAVQGELAHTGIGKESENTFDRYKFRGIDAVYNALAPLLAKHGLCVLPRMLERDCQERQSRKGEPMFYVTVTAEFDFVAAEDGSSHTIRTYGEAMDRSDKATNKAMSAAYKYAAFMAFAIPTEGDNDADATTPDAGSRVSGRDNTGDRQASPPGNLRDQLEQSVEQEAAPEKWTEPGSMYSGIHKLKGGLRSLNSDLEGCGDSGMVYGVTATAEWKEFVRVSELHCPHYLRGGDPAPPEFEGLVTKAERLVAEFDRAEADGKVDMVRAG